MSCGHGFAVSSAFASSATRAAFPTRSCFTTNSHPPVFWWRAPEFGYERRCISESPTASASIPHPVSNSVCSINAPSVEANTLSSRQISAVARVVRRAAAFRIAASARSSRSSPDAIGLGERELWRCGEAPRAVGDGAHREAHLLGAGHRVHVPVADGHLLRTSAHVAHVGVRRPPYARGVQRARGEVAREG